MSPIEPSRLSHANGHILFTRDELYKRLRPTDLLPFTYLSLELLMSIPILEKSTSLGPCTTMIDMMKKLVAENATQQQLEQAVSSLDTLCLTLVESTDPAARDMEEKVKAALDVLQKWIPMSPVLVLTREHDVYMGTAIIANAYGALMGSDGSNDTPVDPEVLRRAGAYYTAMADHFESILNRIYSEINAEKKKRKQFVTYATMNAARHLF